MFNAAYEIMNSPRNSHHQVRIQECMLYWNSILYMEHEVNKLSTMFCLTHQVS